MIDPKELRLGNKFRQPSDERVFEVLALSDDRVAYAKDEYNFGNDYFWFNANEIQPIPLTKEMIESLQHDEDSRFQYVHINLEDGFWQHDLVAGDCKYVHQLQNLYFMLEGKELTINLISPSFSSPQL